MRLACSATCEVYREVFANLKEGMSEKTIGDLVISGFAKMNLHGEALVLLGAAAALPHGSKQPQTLKEGEVVLIDFQDLIWGFEIQDLTISLLAFGWSDDSGESSAAFRAGYEERRPWPEADAEMVAALRAARRLNILNFGLSVRGTGLEAFIARHAAPIVEWMRDSVI